MKFEIKACAWLGKRAVRGGHRRLDPEWLARQGAHDAEAAHYLAIWNGGMREIHAAERDPQKYAESMRDAGRGHLVRHLP